MQVEFYYNILKLKEFIMVWCFINELVNVISNIFSCVILVGMLYCAYSYVLDNCTRNERIITGIVSIIAFLIIVCTYTACKIC